MRILFLSDRFPPERDAASSRVYERAVYWARWGHDVTVLTCAPNHPEGRVFPGYRNDWFSVSTVDGIRVVRLKTYIAPNSGMYRRVLDFVSYMASSFVAGLFHQKPDVVVASSPQIFTAVSGWALGALRDVPYVFELADLWPATIRDVDALSNAPLLDALERMELFLYRESAAVIALTETFRQDLTRRGIPVHKVHVVLNGVDLSRFEPRPRDEALAASVGLAQDDFVVGYIGTHGIAHGLTNVLDAAAILATSQPRAKFLLVGSGAERDALVADVARRRLTNVIMVPPQPKERMPEFWSLCDLALVHLRDLPVFSTVIPSKIFEALGMGLPVVMCLPRGEATEIVEDEGVGCWCPPEDPVALAAVVGRLLTSDDERDRLRSRTAESARRHSRERQALDFLTALESIVKLPEVRA
jgi:glycosyltransferase involved in cell wall biosynthesis